MRSPIYFIAAAASEGLPRLCGKLERLIAASRVLDLVSAGDSVAVKLHFGEAGNTGYVRPELLRVIASSLKARQAKPFLADTNTLYQGRRQESGEHLKLAREHGFTPEAVGAEVVIPDDTKPENAVAVDVSGRFIKTAKVAGLFAQADAFVGVAHFKGHLMTGFGGALKNVGMGCATREGKLAQHSDVSPSIDVKECVGCGQCVAACSAQAISLRADKAVIDAALCVGCAQCLAACPSSAIEVRWEQGGNVIQEKMVEYTRAILAAKKGKAAFFNFCLKVTAECDCLAKDDPCIAPDVGILAGADPVALDQACHDLVLRAAGRDVFKAAHPKRDGAKQLAHAEELGLGRRDYELITVSQ